MIKEAASEFKRLFTKIFYVRSSDSVVVKLEANESMEVIVYTRSKSGAAFDIEDAKDKKKEKFVRKFIVKHTGGDSLEDDPPTRATVVKDLKGPCEINIKAATLGSKLSASIFLVVCKIA